MEDKYVKCTCISVNCVANNPEDITCSGQEYLGFDFYVKLGDALKLNNYIIEKLESLEIPLEFTHIYGHKFLKENDVWTKDMIDKAIEENALFLKFEAARHRNIKIRLY